MSAVIVTAGMFRISAVTMRLTLTAPPPRGRRHNFSDTSSVISSIDAVDNHCTIQLLSRYVPDHDAEIVKGRRAGAL